MKIGIMGAGSVGGYFGALLAAAGHEVAVVARGAHLAAITADGLILEGPRGEVRARVQASEDPAVLAGAEVILFAVKTYDTDAAAQALQGVVTPDSMVLTLQNGVDSLERLSRHLSRGVIVPGAAFVSAVIARPGVIRYTSAMSSMVIGEEDGTVSPRCERFKAACASAGVGCEISTDIRAALWKKFIALATNAALTGVMRQPAGVLYHEPLFRPIVQRSIAEVIAVAERQGVRLPPGAAEGAMAMLQSFPADMYASLYHDLARGRPIEVEALSGLVTRLAAASGIDAPLHQFVYACLKPHEAGAALKPE